ncbi:peptide deformylase [Papillibacter cinnamivorans]|uniref:Peptide deformylase n=1 Tax=Papillibacter cinnamivorans DSM 12816 TaxID=1122930 RepID=A0A1W1YVQ1_9FIRM|nr:peptide deformylase [Papillibacter cinnamivorans]SMC40277.1 peptide deformylase [Papillibacter cinnamivorans DSM 12816]
MALRKILTRGEPTLLKQSRPVTNFDGHLHMLLDDMRETLVDASGAGLAAPQVGVLRRAVLVMDENEEFVELINPEILSVSGEQEGPEGCLSIPGVVGLVRRPMRVKVRALDRFGKPFEMTGEGLTARALCHETEHLNGHLFTERVSRYLSDDELRDYSAEKKRRNG